MNKQRSEYYRMTDFGPIMQFSYVVDDWRVAASHWAKVLNVGPFFALEHVPYKTCTYRNLATDIDMSVAIAYTGNVQIELVDQHNKAPSIFSDFKRDHGQGLHHVAVTTDNLEQLLQHFATNNVLPVQRGEADNGTLFAYLDTALIPGTMLEVVELPNQVKSAFEYMKHKASKWSTDDAPYVVG